ncbi:MAG: bifunctional DNA-formamidopyrimidine glycosylase/DNA-(apurinic or apyrimidinic site) lyase [Candidatus Oxydemutatoraceae bacterium WSBS_2016_MAG_OTU14]
MPELPEVETTRSGVEQHVLGLTIAQVKVRTRNLRYPITRGLEKKLSAGKIQKVARRGKYLLFYTTQGSFIVHLGMSGCLRVVDGKVLAGRHDHVDFVMHNKKILRYCDPRKFGLILWTQQDPLEHPLLKNLGLEPLSASFKGKYLYDLALQRNSIAIKNFIMDSKIVVGVGNIYASEALYDAGIQPARSVRNISLQRFTKLAASIKKILRRAIKKGGTTLKDFAQVDGAPGYFSVSLKVYQRDGEPCVRCKQPIQRRVIGQRSSFYCPQCQH